ncbi:MAG TPA: malto-oligosyltrehalose trehalohydrolase [Acidimicrobiales bacterium]|nr:malto-oligosyltrehalose trehalohydrolase [Acidimicrobiales bacterium]
MNGHRFSVWAPSAQAVELVLGEGRRLPMEPDETRPPDRPGWWAVRVEGAADGTDYGFSLDGGPARPDPRSRWQPEGPEGLSRLVEPAGFEWSDQRWTGVHLPAAVLYELHVGTFTPDGTFDSAISRLDHLVDLGVTAVELMPVAEFSGERGWGYDGVDLFAVQHAYGGPHGLARLVDACHARGLAVVLDVVYNHLGPAGNYLGEFGPYFTDRYATPWGQALNLDGPGSDEVRHFFMDNALAWLGQYHFDGLRLDAVHAIVDTSATHLLEDLSAAVAGLSAQVGRQLFLIAESDLNDPRIVTSRAAGGFGMDAQWSDDFHHALHAVLTGETSGYYADFGTMQDLATALQRAFVYDGRHSHHRGRRHGRRPDGLAGWSFLGYLQNHDQIGNRAMGERSRALMSVGRLKVAAALVLCSPFVPMLFQGEEWGASTPFQYFTAHPDPELGRAVSEGRRSEFESFGWEPEDVPDPQDPATFLRSKLDWSELTRPPHAELLAWHRQLIALRRRRPELTDGRLDRVEIHHGPDWLSCRRGGVLVAMNIGDETRTLPLNGPGPRLLLGSAEKVSLGTGGVELVPDSAAVVSFEAVS